MKIGRSALGLLAYLALYASHPLPREKVSAELWPECDPERACSRLSTALWRLRTALGKDRCGSVVTQAGEAAIGLTPAVLDAVDTRRFEAEARRFLADNDGARDWRDGADDAGPRGEPLAGWYSVWALSARVRLEDLGERCLTVLLERQYAAGANLAAIETAERLLQIDTLREDVHQALMRIYLRQGITGLAARQYERCRLTLAEELGVEPTAETKALRAGIAQPCSRPHRPAFDPALGTVAGKDLQGVRKAISETQRGLTRLSHKLDTLDRFQS